MFSKKKFQKSLRFAARLLGRSECNGRARKHKALHLNVHLKVYTHIFFCLFLPRFNEKGNQDGTRIINYHTQS
jgi:hypothetical protein